MQWPLRVIIAGMVGIIVVLAWSVYLDRTINGPHAAAKFQVDIRYKYDERTGLCFASGGPGTAPRYTLVVVPCTPAVLKLTGGPWE